MSYWFIWPLGIVVWLVIGWAFFAWFESRALKHDARKEQITLSMFCYTIGSKFPLSLFIGGLLVGLFWGILMTHLTWHWCPPGSTSEGLLEMPVSTTLVSIGCRPITLGGEHVCAEIERQRR